MTPHSTPQRFHHLDALRAFAMLLGLVLHGFMSFIVIPMWPAQDIHPNDDVYGFLLYAIHGFRMPLFFLISGFFTAMLWRRRGTVGLLKNRAIRIVVPMIAGVILVWPAMIALGIWGNAVKARNAIERTESGSEELSIWNAAKQGNIETLTKILNDGAGVDKPDSFGITPLAWAAMSGKVEAVEALIGHGANVNASNQDGNSPLHGAAFLGRSEIVAFLLENGAVVNARNSRGGTPLDSAGAPWGIVKWVCGMLRIDLDQEEIMSGRKKTVELLKSAGSDSESESQSSDRNENLVETLVKIWTFGAMMPFFHHLWFLYYLCLLVILFVLFAPLFSRLPDKHSAVLVRPIIRWLWLVPLTFAAQYLMRQSFGPDTATGLLPWPPKLFYYSIFFGFGALCFGKEAFEKRAGKFWLIHFLLAVPVLFAGLHYFELRNENFVIYHGLASLFAVVYAWMMIFGFIGVFRQFFSAENSKTRYLSDSTYWLYLAHLPLVMALQISVSGWDFPSFVKLPAILLVLTFVLLLTYDFFVRYTWVGAILNGRKTRT